MRDEKSLQNTLEDFVFMTLENNLYRFAQSILICTEQFKQ